MPAGVRLHHPFLRSCVFTITNYAVRLVAPMYCWSCSGAPEGQSQRPIIHEFKTFHLTIDAVGDVVVAEGIYELMKRNGLLEDLRAMKEIRTPDPMRLDLGQFKVPVTVSREKGFIGG